jgi:long-chain acyl-CoA synthetase
VNPQEIEGKLLKKYKSIKEVGLFQEDKVLQVIIYPEFHYLKEQGIKDPHTYFESEVIGQYNKSVPSGKRIKKVHIIKTELPKTPLGKMKRHKIKGVLKKPLGKKQVQEPDYEEYHILKKLIQKETGQSVRPDDHFEYDIALDSLNIASLTVPYPGFSELRSEKRK